MNSESDKRFQEAKRIAEQNFAAAEKPTPCVTITEANWKAMILTMKAQAEMIEQMRLTVKDIPSKEEMVSFINQTKDIHLSYEQLWKDELRDREKTWKEELESQTKNWQEEMTKQVGNLNGQYASALEKTRTELQKQMKENTEKLYHRILMPCLLTTLLAAVLTLLQIL